MPIAATLAVAVGAGVALAGMNGNGDEVIYACAKKNNGQLRVVAGAADCTSAENPISWSSQDTPIRYYTVDVNTGAGGGGGDPIPAGESKSLQVTCEPGDVVTGGGASVSGNGVLKTSAPGIAFPDPTPIAWIAFAVNPGPGTAGFAVSAVCADLTP